MRYRLTLCTALAVLIPTATASAAFTQFQTPSHNIYCVIRTYTDGFGFAQCIAYVPGKASIVTRSGAGHRTSFDPTEGKLPAAVLGYGRTRSLGGFTCSSSEAGVTCRYRRTGHGFSISQQSDRRF